MNAKIAILTTSFGEYDKSPVEFCERAGYAVTFNPYGRKLKPDEVVKVAGEAVGIIAGTETISADMLSGLPRLKVISRCGVGMENVDLEAARRHGIMVFNTPDAPTEAVAELAIGLILNLLRKTSRMDRAVRSGVWEKLMGNLLSGKHVGIIGFGRIGKRVAELLTAFGCEVIYYDPFIKEKSPGFKSVSMAELLKTSDIVTVHASTKETILRGSEISSMKKGGWLVNISRGEAVDEDALYSALKSGHLAGAAMDVFKEEPYKGPLIELNNVVLTPHVGSYAKESRVQMEKQAVENLLKGLESAI